MGEWAEATGEDNFFVAAADLPAVCDAIDAAGGWDTNNEKTKTPQERLKYLLDAVCSDLEPGFDEEGNWVGTAGCDFKFGDEQKELLEPIAPWVKPSDPEDADKDPEGNPIAYIGYDRPGEHWRCCWSGGKFYYMEGIATIDWARCDL